MAAENLTQTEMAQKLGIDPSLFSLIMTGKRTSSLDVSKAIYRRYPELADLLLGPAAGECSKR